MTSVNDSTDLDMVTEAPPNPEASGKRLLVAASGTGGHLFPALAVSEELADYQVEWLGVPNRMETRLVPSAYPLHTIPVEGIQQRFSLKLIFLPSRLVNSVLQVRRLLRQGKFHGLLTTGGYIAAPAIIAGRSLGLPTILHESNALPGKVTRWLSPWCSTVALGFETAAQYLPKAKTVFVGTPVRSQFFEPCDCELPVPEDALLIVVAGGSQGAVAVNRLVRQCAPAWLEAGAWIVHLTGDNDPDAKAFEHPHYLSMPFYDNMAGLWQRANLAISRSGAGTLTELAVTQTPAILIPYPYAAEDHQAHNAAVFAAVGGAAVFRESALAPAVLEAEVLDLLRSPQTLAEMTSAVASLAVTDSTERLAELVRQLLSRPRKESS